MSNNSELNIFISYCWKNKTYRETLIRILEGAHYNAVYDENLILPGDELDEGIIKLLNQSDAVIVCLTKKSVKSKAVREELTRAHHQGLKIYSVVHRSVISAMPTFLKGKVYLDYETDDELITTLKKLVGNIKKDEKLLKASSKVHHLIQKQHGNADHLISRERFRKPEGKWSHKLMATLFNNVDNELQSLSSAHYEAIVSKDANFLMRAKPIFQKAFQIYAVSIDTVSTFWVSKKTSDQKLAKKYLKTQPENTMRLFVFTNPDAAHNHANVLDIHSKKYGSSGGVFICSRKAYINLVKKWGCDENDPDLLNCDFGVLEYKNAAQTFYEAKLDREFFKVKRVHNLHHLQHRAEEMQTSFSNLRNLSAGERDESINVMRWELGLHRKHDRWIEALEGLFQKRDRDILHLVLFTQEALHNDDAITKIRERVHELRSALKGLPIDGSHSIVVKDVWFGESEVVKARDARTQGLLKTEESRRFPYVLFIRFENAQNLKDWYELPKHYEIRRGLFEAFDIKLAELFSLIDKKAADSPSEIMQIYEKIESRVYDFMRRMDYTDTDTISDLILREPFSPVTD